MKIEKARVGQRVRTRSGVTGTIGKIDHNHVTIYDAVGMPPGNYIAAIENVEPVCDPCRFAKGDKVRATGKSIYGADIEGKTFVVSNPNTDTTEDGEVVSLNGGCQKPEATRLKAFWEGQAAANADVGNAMDVLRKDRDNWKQLAESRCDNCQRIAELRQSSDEWKATAQAATRNAFYWREELTKLQKEALAECKPLGEVAKIYIRVSPEELERILKGRD